MNLYCFTYDYGSVFGSPFSVLDVAFLVQIEDCTKEEIKISSWKINQCYHGRWEQNKYWPLDAFLTFLYSTKITWHFFKSKDDQTARDIIFSGKYG